MAFSNYKFHSPSTHLSKNANLVKFILAKLYSVVPISEFYHITDDKTVTKNNLGKQRIY